MRSRILHLLTGVFMLVAFVQCQESISSVGSPPDSGSEQPNVNLKETTLIIPGNNSEQETSVSFDWEEVEGAESYQIQLSGDKDFSSIIVDSTSASANFEIKGLPYDSTIHWQVRPITGQQQGPWSVAWQFITMQKPDNSEPMSTDLKSPDNEASDRSTNVELQWTAVASASAYKVQVATDESFNSIVADKEVESTSYQTSDLDFESTYYWRVEPVISGEETDWSTIYRFDTQAESEQTASVTLVSPSDDASDISTSPTLEWEELSDIDKYKVQVAPSNSFNAPVIDDNATDNVLDISGLDNDQNYYWRVQASEDGDPSNWSSVRTFSTKSNDSGDKEPDSDGPNSVEGDRQALMDLYQATNGSNWNNSSGWGNGDPSNNWHGVEVDAEGRVVQLDLYKNGLNGNLPESIGNLTKVKYLNLKGNSLSGKIPSSIGNMASLEWLILAGRTYSIGGHTKEPPTLSEMENGWAYHSGKHRSSTNNLSGQIPSTIGNLTNLLYLEISDQINIVGPIPSEIGNLTKLLGLYLNLNDFSGTSIPSSIGNLTQLRHLYLSDSQLTGEIPSSFKNLVHLTSISMGSTKNKLPGNNLTGDLPDFSELYQLYDLWMSTNQLDGTYPHYFNNGNFTKLRHLQLAWNNLTGTLHSFENLPNLQQVALSGNNLSGTIGSQLLTLPEQLQILSIGWNSFSGELAQNGWPDFHQMKTLYINDNSLSGVLSCDFFNKIQNPKLNIVRYNNNNFSSTCQ